MRKSILNYDYTYNEDAQYLVYASALSFKHRVLTCGLRLIESYLTETLQRHVLVVFSLRNSLHL